MVLSLNSAVVHQSFNDSLTSFDGVVAVENSSRTFCYISVEEGREISIVPKPFFFVVGKLLGSLAQKVSTSVASIIGPAAAYVSNLAQPIANDRFSFPALLPVAEAMPSDICVEKEGIQNFVPDMAAVFSREMNEINVCKPLALYDEFSECIESNDVSNFMSLANDKNISSFLSKDGCEGRSVLHLCLEKGAYLIFKHIVEEYKNETKKILASRNRFEQGIYEKSILHLAIEKGSKKEVRESITRIVEGCKDETKEILTAVDSSGKSIYEKNIIHLLLEYDMQGILSIILDQYKDEIRKILLSVDSYGDLIYGENFLQLVFKNGLDQISKNVLEDYKDEVKRMLTAEDDLGNLIYGDNLLHFTLQHEQPGICNYLLKNYTNETKKLLAHSDQSGFLPIHIAAQKGNEKVIRTMHDINTTLINTPSSPRKKKPSISSSLPIIKSPNDVMEKLYPIHMAIENEHLKIAICLVELGANRTITTTAEETPLKTLRKGIGEGFFNKSKEDFDDSFYLEGLLKDPSLAVIKPINRPNYFRTPPRFIFWGGGGPKGAAYPGAVEYLEERNFVDTVEVVAGTSVGSIAAAFFAVGYNSSELKELLSYNFEEFLYPPQRKDFSSQFERIRRCILNLHRSSGCIDGDRLRDWVEEKIQAKTNISNCTFMELHSLANKTESSFKDLYVLTHETGHPLYRGVKALGYTPIRKGRHYGDVIIASAIQAATAIPFVFSPSRLIEKNKKDITTVLNFSQEHFDTGYISNVHIEFFDSEPFQMNTSIGGSSTNWEAIAFSLVNYNETSRFFTKWKVLDALLSGWWYSESIHQASIAGVKDRIIDIDVDIGLLDFDLSESQKDTAYQVGKNSTRHFFENSKGINRENSKDDDTWDPWIDRIGFLGILAGYGCAGCIPCRYIRNEVRSIIVLGGTLVDFIQVKHVLGLAILKTCMNINREFPSFPFSFTNIGYLGWKLYQSSIKGPIFLAIASGSALGYSLKYCSSRQLRPV